jgi:hypothetical protein
MSLIDPRAGWLLRIALALLLADGLVFVLLVLPARDQRRSQEAQLLDLQRRIRAVQREGQASEGLLTAFREVEEFSQGFPRRAELVGIIGRLTKLAQSLAVAVPAVDYKPAERQEADLTKVTLLLSVEGSYGKLRRYLYELERLRHLVIERVALSDPQGTSSVHLQLQLALYLREAER